MLATVPSASCFFSGNWSTASGFETCPGVLGFDCTLHFVLGSVRSIRRGFTFCNFFLYTGLLGATTSKPPSPHSRRRTCRVGSHMTRTTCSSSFSPAVQHPCSIFGMVYCASIIFGVLISHCISVPHLLKSHIAVLFLRVSKLCQLGC